MKNDQINGTEIWVKLYHIFSLRLPPSLPNSLAYGSVEKTLLSGKESGSCHKLTPGRWDEAICEPFPCLELLLIDLRAMKGVEWL